MIDRLRPLWDFRALDASEARFREALAGEATEAARAEVLTQLARVEGLRGRFEEGEKLVAEAERSAGSEVARVRVDLERGRLLRSGGDPAAALPLLEAAFAGASACGQCFLAADAAHMAALVAGNREGFVEWTQRGIDLASTEAAAAYWLGPLLNNLGWELYEAEEYEAALDAFERALAVREQEAERPYEIEIARFTVGKTLRALGRAEEAAALLEQAVSWAREAGIPDAFFHEELAEDYAALGRREEAAEQARLALGLLDLETADAQQLARLRELAQPE